MSRKVKVDQLIPLETIARSADATEVEVVNALLLWSYQLPHVQWDVIVQKYRNREKNA